MRARLSERLEEKRREAQDLREELRHLRGEDEDEDVMRVPTGAAAWDESDAEDSPEPHLSQTAEHDEVELGPLDEPTIAEDDDGEEEVGGSTRAMRLDEVEWEDVEDPPRKRDDE